MRRVVVTGLGTINPLGNNVKDSWDSLINSKSGLKNITTFDVNNYPCQIAGSIDPEFIREDIVPLREQRKIDRFITLGLVAAHEAFLDSGFEVNEENSLRSGVMVGSGIGGLDTIYKNSSIHIMPTISTPESIEGFGISNVEAASFGLPCLISNSGGTPESIGENGIIVKENDPKKAKEIVENMCSKLLANLVIENYKIIETQ